MLNSTPFLHLFMNNPVIGYLSLHEHEKTEYLGSLLITNLAGTPLEFRCTQPIVPDAIQRSLYGTGLLEYLGVEVCGRPLIRSAKLKPKCIFIEQSFLMALNDYISWPIVFVREFRGEEPPSPITLKYPYQSDVVKPQQQDLNLLQIAQKDAIALKTIDFVTQLAHKINFIEPFDRMRQAVQNLHQLTLPSPER